MTKAKEKVGHALRFSISAKDTGNERCILAVITHDSCPEQPALKKRKLQNEDVSKLCEEDNSADCSLIDALMLVQNLFSDFLGESSWKQFTTEQSNASTVDENEIDRLLNDPFIYDFDSHEDNNDEFMDEEMQSAMDSHETVFDDYELEGLINDPFAFECGVFEGVSDENILDSIDALVPLDDLNP